MLLEFVFVSMPVVLHVLSDCDAHLECLDD